MPKSNAKLMVFLVHKSHGKKLLVSWNIVVVNTRKTYVLWYPDIGNFMIIIFTGPSPGEYKDLKNNSDIKVEDGTLTINNIQKSNEGYYLCEAVNGIGSGLSAVINVNVQGKC